MKRKKAKGITIEFINTPKEGAKMKAPGAWLDALVETAKLNKANRILIVFDRQL